MRSDQHGVVTITGAHSLFIFSTTFALPFSLSFIFLIDSSIVRRSSSAFLARSKVSWRSLLRSAWSASSSSVGGTASGVILTVRGRNGCTWGYGASKDDIGSSKVRALPSGLETGKKVGSECTEGRSDRISGLSGDGRVEYLESWREQGGRATWNSEPVRDKVCARHRGLLSHAQ